MSLPDFIQITCFSFCQPNQELQLAAINQTVVIFPVQCLIEMVQLEIILRTLETVKGNTKDFLQQSSFLLQQLVLQDLSRNRD